MSNYLDELDRITIKTSRVFRWAWAVVALFSAAVTIGYFFTPLWGFGIVWAILTGAYVWLAWFNHRQYVAARDRLNKWPPADNSR